LDAAGEPVISYFDGSNTDLKLVHCNDADCAGGGESSVTVDNAGFVGAYGSLELDAAGNPVISYNDASNGDLKLAHCNDPNCIGGGESIVALDSAGNVGLFTSVELDAAGEPVISYFDASNTALKVAHCHDANCAGGGNSIVTVDNGGDVGRHSSLQLDAVGNPVVSYQDTGSGDLKVVHCDGADCAGSGTSIVTVDQHLNVGWETSLVLDAAGYPVVSHRDETLADLKLAHCETATCAPPACAGATATIVGTAGNDVINGTDGADVVAAGAGNDTIDGLGGDDVICGDDGSDVLAGGAGRDVIYGGTGHDELAGGDGNDELTGGPDTDELAGGAGNDHVDGGDGDDMITGQDGDDVLTGAADDDTVAGNDGTDVIAGGPGDDRLEGDAGLDTADYVFASAAVAASLSTGSAIGDGNDVLRGFERVVGSSFDDILLGDEGNNELDGGAGNDSLWGSDGNDVIDGSLGDDVVFGGDGDDVLVGARGDNLIEAGAGIDTASYAGSESPVTADLTGRLATGDGIDMLGDVEGLVGSRFDDTLTGDGGNNAIDGGAGSDTVSGRAGDDVLVGSVGDDTIGGGEGFDTADFSASPAAVTVDLASGTAAGEGTDVVQSVEDVAGSIFDDRLTGNSGANSIDGGMGDDVVAGLSGDDALTGGQGIDTVTYANSVTGVAASLTTGTASGAGDDQLVGFENLVGSPFDDVLGGDAGANDLQGGPGVDTVTFAASPRPVSADLTAGLAGGSGADRLSGFEDVVGSPFDDLLTGDAGPNSIQGGAGNDTVAGHGGNDVLDGGAGVDTASFAAATRAVTASLAAGTAAGDGADLLLGFENLRGSTFADVLTGNAGPNTLSGGSGNDRFSAGAGNDAVDGGAGVDTLSFVPAINPVTANLTAGTAVGEGSDRLTRLEALVGSSFADRLTGDAHRNSLVGGDGNDRLAGVAGNDALNGGTDFDRADGGTGVDTQRRCEMILNVP
jgi:Ca2+-binding RTX toxin-like protein